MIVKLFISIKSYLTSEFLLSFSCSIVDIHKTDIFIETAFD